MACSAGRAGRVRARRFWNAASRQDDHHPGGSRFVWISDFLPDDFLPDGLTASLGR